MEQLALNEQKKMLTQAEVESMLKLSQIANLPPDPQVLLE